MANLENINGMVTILEEKLTDFKEEDNYMFDIEDDKVLSKFLFTLAGARITEKLSVDIKLKELDDLYSSLCQNLNFFTWTIDELLRPELKSLSKEMDEADLEDTLEEIEWLEDQLEEINASYKNKYSMIKEAIKQNEICTIGNFE